MRVAVRVVPLEGSGVFDGISRDVGLGGMFLETEEPLPVGSELSVSFRLSHAPTPVDLRAVVRWSTDEGIGVQFLRLRAYDVWSLHRALWMPSSQGSTRVGE
jgi:hypothetical protein